MPSESKLTYKDTQLWMDDGYLLIMYLYLFDELKNESKEFDLLRIELAENICDLLVDGFGFLDFSEFINSETMLIRLQAHFKNIIERISANDSIFSLEYLESIVQSARLLLQKLNYNTPDGKIASKYGSGLAEVKMNYIRAFEKISSMFT